MWWLLHSKMKEHSTNRPWCMSNSASTHDLCHTYSMVIIWITGLTAQVDHLSKQRGTTMTYKQGGLSPHSHRGRWPLLQQHWYSQPVRLSLWHTGHSLHRLGMATCSTHDPNKWAFWGQGFLPRLSGLFDYPAMLTNKGVRIIEVLLYSCGFPH